MTRRHEPSFAQLEFYTTAPYGCSYLPHCIARSQIATPGHLIDTDTYGKLIHCGFRRSGAFIYRPQCDTCQACIPVRLIAARYQPTRSQRRALTRHADLIATRRPLTFQEDHYALYQRYQQARHSGSGMDLDNRQQYKQFLLQSPIETLLIEFRDDPAKHHGRDTLRMVSLIDLLPDGLSSVYTFYDPDLPAASLGTYGILWQIAQCTHLNLSYVYLGYWIEHSRKMAYKSTFQPLEALIDGHWQDFSILGASNAQDLLPE